MVNQISRQHTHNRTAHNYRILLHYWQVTTVYSLERLPALFSSRPHPPPCRVRSKKRDAGAGLRFSIPCRCDNIAMAANAWCWIDGTEAFEACDSKFGRAGVRLQHSGGNKLCIRCNNSPAKKKKNMQSSFIKVFFPRYLDLLNPGNHFSESLRSV